MTPVDPNAWDWAWHPTERECPTCEGKGVNPVMPMLLCPKCKGERVLPPLRRLVR
jgi:DnaJ-class molecular chaperone